MIYNITHGGGCNDGLASAWVVQRYFSNMPNKPSVIFSTYNYEWKKNQFKSGDKIYFTDFSPKPDEAVNLLNHGIEFVVFDHHATTMEELRNYEDKVFIEHNYNLNTSYCGAILTWKHFFPTEEVPLLLEYINIADMWQWEKKKDSKEVCMWIRNNLILNDINSFDNLFKNFDLKKAICEGSLLLKYRDKLVEELAYNKYEIDFHGIKVHAINDSLFSSELGHVLENSSPSGLGLTYYISATNKTVKVSVRGNGAKEFCEKYGGGGHPHAAGFIMNLESFIRFLDTAKPINKNF